jgi:hypothetical protein
MSVQNNGAKFSSLFMDKVVASREHEVVSCATWLAD